MRANHFINPATIKNPAGSDIEETLMHRLAKGLALIIGSIGVTASLHAVDRGQFNDMPDEVRAWFKSVR